MKVTHVRSSFPIPLGARITGVDDCTFSSNGEAFSTILLPETESQREKLVQSDDTTLTYEFARKVNSKAICFGHFPLQTQAVVYSHFPSTCFPFARSSRASKHTTNRHQPPPTSTRRESENTLAIHSSISPCLLLLVSQHRLQPDDQGHPRGGPAPLCACCRCKFLLRTKLTHLESNPAFTTLTTLTTLTSHFHNSLLTLPFHRTIPLFRLSRRMPTSCRFVPQNTTQDCAVFEYA